MNILIIANLYPLPWEPNRATFNKQQFDYLSERHSVTILVPVAWKEYLKHHKVIQNENLKNDKVKYFCYWYTPKVLHQFFGEFMMASLWFGARKLLKSAEYDCVLGSWADPEGYVAKQLSHKFNIPYFVKVHGSDINILSEDESRRARIVAVCKDAHAVFTPSNALRDKVIALGAKPEKVVRIYNGVNSRLFFPERIDQRYFLFVGNLKKDKGVFDLLNAYSNYVKAEGDIPLRIVGDGAELSRLKDLVTSLKLESLVTFEGARPHEETASFTRCCFSLILPSYHEGVPNVLLEAVSCAVPVIATKVGGIPEVVDDNKTGILVDAGDVAALSKALLEMDKDRRWEDIDFSAKAKNFCWSNNVDTLETVITKNID